VSRVNVAIALADEARIRMDEVAAACRACGFDHIATLSAAGILTGSVEFEKLASVRAVPGVLTVEVECQCPQAITARADDRGLLN
jgi:uncharacterized protein (DUF1697 family)